MGTRKAKVGGRQRVWLDLVERVKEGMLVVWREPVNQLTRAGGQETSSNEQKGSLRELVCASQLFRPAATALRARVPFSSRVKS